MLPLLRSYMHNAGEGGGCELVIYSTGLITVMSPGCQRPGGPACLQLTCLVLPLPCGSLTRCQFRSG